MLNNKRMIFIIILGIVISVIAGLVGYKLYLVNLDKKPEWEIVKSSPVYAHNDICFKFLTYKRVK